MKRILHLLVMLFFANYSFSQDSAEDRKEVISWLQSIAVPIRHIEAGNSFSDLQPLKKILKDVRVVGLGENTHGTREFFQLKHRLLEFLVTEMGFTAFALEAGYGSCGPINSYVLHGKGDLESVLTAQGYVVWDTEELAGMIEWMRTYNQTVPDEKKVAFFGIDFMYNEPARQYVLSYLQKYSPEAAPAADSLFQTLSQQENQWSKEKDKNLLAIARHQLRKQILYLNDHKLRLIAASSTKEFEQALKYLQVMEQWFMLHIPDPADSLSTSNMKRSRAMAANLLYLMESEKPNAKFVVWEHNVHLGNGEMETGESNLGHVLKQRIGESFYSIAFEFGRGTYQSRLRSPGKFGNLQEVTVPAAPEGYLADYLTEARKGNMFWNLRDSVDNYTVRQWLGNPQVMRYFGWFNDDKPLKKVHLKKRYDGIIFVDQTTATRPTKNALATVSRGEGL